MGSPRHMRCICATRERYLGTVPKYRSELWEHGGVIPDEIARRLGLQVTAPPPSERIAADPIRLEGDRDGFQVLVTLRGGESGSAQIRVSGVSPGIELRKTSGSRTGLPTGDPA